MLSSWFSEIHFYTN